MNSLLMNIRLQMALLYIWLREVIRVAQSQRFLQTTILAPQLLLPQAQEINHSHPIPSLDLEAWVVCQEEWEAWVECLEWACQEWVVWVAWEVSLQTPR